MSTFRALGAAVRVIVDVGAGGSGGAAVCTAPPGLMEGRRRLTAAPRTVPILPIPGRELGAYDEIVRARHAEGTEVDLR